MARGDHQKRENKGKKKGEFSQNSQYSLTEETRSGSGAFLPPKLKGRNPRQTEFLELLNNEKLILCNGAVGTGKTFLTAGVAAEKLRRKEIDKIVITRPIAVIDSGNAKEDLGFLPGTKDEKMEEWVRPMVDALKEFLGAEFYSDAKRQGRIEIAPLAFIRGRTMNKAFMIIDEAQNTTPNTLAAFLTRAGKNTTVVALGDTNQKDIPGVSGLAYFMDLAQAHKDDQNKNYPVKFCTMQFGVSDIERSDIAKSVAYLLEKDKERQRELVPGK